MRYMANDWVDYKGEPRRVVMIYKDETVGLENDGYFDEERIEYVEPIPLTSEILEKNGFKESGVNGFYTKHRFGCSIKIGYPRFMVSDGLTEEWVSARYVHELQQMFRLCLMDDDFADNFQV